MLLKGYLDSKRIGRNAVTAEPLLQIGPLGPGRGTRHVHFARWNCLQRPMVAAEPQAQLLRSHEVDQGSESGDPG